MRAKAPLFSRRKMDRLGLTCFCALSKKSLLFEAKFNATNDLSSVWNEEISFGAIVSKVINSRLEFCGRPCSSALRKGENVLPNMTAIPPVFLLWMPRSIGFCAHAKQGRRTQKSNSDSLLKRELFIVAAKYIADLLFANACPKMKTQLIKTRRQAHFACGPSRTEAEHPPPRFGGLNSIRARPSNLVVPP